MDEFLTRGMSVIAGEIKIRTDFIPATKLFLLYTGSRKD
jgi:hypothetical protein